MQDFSQIFTDWIKFFEEQNDAKKQVFDAIHPEVKKGFDVITRISTEEIAKRVTDKEFVERAKQLLIRLFAFSVFGGYMLYCIYNSVDPVSQNLASKEETTDIGKRWMEGYKADNFRGLISRIPPLLVLMLERGKQARMSQLIKAHSEVMNFTFNEGNQIDQFLRWAAIQGYVLGILENQSGTAQPSNESGSQEFQEA